MLISKGNCFDELRQQAEAGRADDAQRAKPWTPLTTAQQQSAAKFASMLGIGGKNRRARLWFKASLATVEADHENRPFDRSAPTRLGGLGKDRGLLPGNSKDRSRNPARLGGGE